MDKEENVFLKKVRDKFGELKKPEEYDFKQEMKEYYQKYNEKYKHKKILEEIDKKIDGEKNSVSRWFAYKTLEKEINKKKYKEFDCDNSNDTCELTKAIYYCLWGWKKGSKNNFGKLLTLSEDNINDEFGGDTMNSLGTTLVKYMKEKSVKDCKKQWDKEMKRIEENPLFYDFAKYTSCIGNFVLVPAGFNKHRGLHLCIKDFWDLSLDYLAYTEKNQWLPIGKDPIEQEHAGDNRAFVKYINMFFLWDYVNEKYEVRPLVDCHKERLGCKPLSPDPGTIFPEDEDGYQKYFENVNEYIRRRGIFMAAMLKIAVKFKDVEIRESNANEKWSAWVGWEVSDVYKYIVKNVFLTNELYADYKAVIKKIISVVEKNQVLPSEEKEKLCNILQCAKEGIDKDNSHQD